jgi:hypothetical protein
MKKLYPFIQANKTGFLLLLCFAILWGVSSVHAQSNTVVAVGGIDMRSTEITSSSAGSLVQMELERLNAFRVIDRYELRDKAKANNIDIDQCFSLSSLVQAGKLVNADKMIAGSVDLYGETFVFQMRIIDVKGNFIEKTQVDEYRRLPAQLQKMFRITLLKLIGQEYDTALELSLKNDDAYESSTNNPYVNRLRLNGPRIGLAALFGSAAERIQAPISEGGFNGYPLLTFIGYQQEYYYLNQGKFQALVEFIPMISGLDQGLFNPGLNVLLGFRNNSNGLEFGLGPQISFITMARGYEVNGKWYTENEVNEKNIDISQVEQERRVDSRGNIALHSAFVFAIGKSFRSGRVNIPINLFIVPSKNNFRVGFSFGFNALAKTEE